MKMHNRIKMLKKMIQISISIKTKKGIICPLTLLCDRLILSIFVRGCKRG